MVPSILGSMTTNCALLEGAQKLDGIDLDAAKRDDRDPERFANFRKQT